MQPFPTEPSDPPSGPADRARPSAGRRTVAAPDPGLLALRIAIVAMGLTIGVLLLARGDLVLGGLLVVFAGLRLAVFVTMRRRRQQWRDARERFLRTR